MENKIKISDDFIVGKLVLVGGGCLTFLLLSDSSSSNSETNILSFIIFVLVTIYLFLQKRVFYDDANIYSISFTGKEEKILLSKIKSISSSISIRGTRRISIKYDKESGEEISLTFNNSAHIIYSTFCAHAKQKNHRIKIS